MTEEPRYRAAPGGWYYYVSPYGEILFVRDYRCDFEQSLYDVGNYFISRAEAEDSVFYKVFTNILNKDGDPQIQNRRRSTH
jgi:hypothetical protein